jgi:hypothetical protein
MVSVLSNCRPAKPGDTNDRGAAHVNGTQNAVLPDRDEAGADASVDLLALENQVCFALAVAARTVISA